MKKIYTNPEIDMNMFSFENIITASGNELALDDVKSQLAPGTGGRSVEIDFSQITWVP